MAKSSKKEYDVFISHAGGGGYKTTLALPLQNLFDSVGISSFVDEMELKPADNVDDKIIDAILLARVFLVLIDNHYFLHSTYCMEELELALKQDRCLVFPVFLSHTSTYPNTLPESDFIKFKKKGWSCERFACVIEGILSCAGLRAHEDRSFQLEHIVVSIKHYFEFGETLGALDLLKQENQEFTDQLKLEVLKKRFGSSSVWRLVNPIKLCRPPSLDSRTINLHESSYYIVKEHLLNDDSSISTIGLRAAGGTGKTWLAVRLANDPELLGYFVDGILWASFGIETATIEKALRDLWIDLSGSKQDFDLSKASLLFEQILQGRRNPRMLLILDDVWQKKYLDIFLPLMKKGSNIRLLVTSRQEDIIREACGKSCRIQTLNSELNELEAIELMKVYGNWVKERDAYHHEEEHMKRIGKIMGFHPKALAIISTQASCYSSWEEFADTVEENHSIAAIQAQEVVEEAIEFTFTRIFGTNQEMKMRFLKLGVFYEDSRFTIEDVAIAWNLRKAAHAKESFFKFVRASLVETQFRNGKEGDKNDIVASEYFMHDLVREYVRKHGKQHKLEKKFVASMCKMVELEKTRVTQYIFDWLPTHLKGDLKRSQISADITSTYEKAKIGEYTPTWSENEFIVYTAIKSNPSQLNYIGDSLWNKSKVFIHRVLQTRDEWEISGCKWCSEINGIKNLGASLSSNLNVIIMKLTSSSIGDSGAIVIAKVLERNHILIKLELDQNSIGDEGAVALGTALAKNATLQELSLYGNEIADEGALNLASGLKFNSTLQNLYLIENRVGDNGASALGKALENNTGLRKLLLEWNKIGDVGASSLGWSLGKSSTLQNLSLPGNRIGDQGAIAIGQSLEKNSILEDLDLWSNKKISDAGAIALGKGLEKNKTLKYLNLWENQIGDEGAHAIGRALEKNTTLLTLSLDSNQIKDDGARSLAKGLKKNTALRKLYLGGNLIGDEGASALGKGLEVNSTLENLSFWENRIGDKGAMALGRALHVNSSLQSLSLYDNKLAESLEVLKESKRIVL